ncbi:PAS domain S-box protein [Pusillimonas sp.]|uniref:PAS domain S-box protein n=1 Tax=Pusillimonas sp. TaxID=3040095 RepID=UPI0037C8D53F
MHQPCPNLASLPELPDPSHPGLSGEASPWLVLENTIVGIAYMRHRRFIWANARMAEIFGYEPDELRGQAVRRLYARQEDYNEVGRLMQGPLTDGFHTHERALAKKDGSLIWCKVSGRPLAPEDPLSPSIWVVQDHSEKKQAEDALRRLNQQLEHAIQMRTLNLQRINRTLTTEIERRRELQALAVDTREKYRALFRHLPLGALVANEDGAISEVNRTLQITLGAPTPRLIKTLTEDRTRVLLPSGQHTSLVELIKYQALQTGQMVNRFSFAWNHPREDQRELTAIAARLAHNKKGVVFTISDVTDLKRQQRREHEQQTTMAHAARLSLIGQMASSLAHELGQPLNACQSYLGGIRNYLEQHQALDPKIQAELFQALDKTRLHLEQADEIVRSTRNFISRQQPEFSPVAIDDLLDQTLRLLELQIHSAQVKIDVKIDTKENLQLPPAYCHPVEIQQVIVNLIINAIEAMSDTEPNDKIIHIRVFSQNYNNLTIDVIDHGPGVAASLIPSLFDPYVTTKATGLGMGLMISRNIIEWHGGTLRLQSNPGGTCFRFTLPAYRGP